MDTVHIQFYGPRPIKGAGNFGHLEIDFVGVLHHNKYGALDPCKLMNREDNNGIFIRKTSCKEMGVSPQRIQLICKQGRIPGAFIIGNSWAIPADAEKPKDQRIKSGKYIKNTKY